MLMLSAHFSLDQLTRSDIAARLGIDNTPGEMELRNLKSLAEALDNIHESLGPLVVTSGFRCKKLNLAIPGSSISSAHTKGYAADFHVAAIHPLELCERVQKLTFPHFDQIIYEFGSWCHFSVDPQGRGQCLTKKANHPIELGLLP